MFASASLCLTLPSLPILVALGGSTKAVFFSVIVILLFLVIVWSSTWRWSVRASCTVMLFNAKG